MAVFERGADAENRTTAVLAARTPIRQVQTLLTASGVVYYTVRTVGATVGGGASPQPPSQYPREITIHTIHIPHTSKDTKK